MDLPQRNSTGTSRGSTDERSDTDPVTGEPRRGWLGTYQKIENLLGQGAVASLMIFLGFLAFAIWQVCVL